VWPLSGGISTCRATSSEAGGALLLPPRACDAPIEFTAAKLGRSLETPCAQGMGDPAPQLFRCGFLPHTRNRRQTTGACSWSTLTTTHPLAQGLEAVGRRERSRRFAGSGKVGNVQAEPAGPPPPPPPPKKKGEGSAFAC